MKSRPSFSLHLHFDKPFWTVAVAIATLTFAGCSKSPDAPTQAQQNRAIDSQIQAIQNNPTMPTGAKQQAINGLKAQQSRQ